MHGFMNVSVKSLRYGTGNESDKLIIIEVCDLNRPEAKYRLTWFLFFMLHCTEYSNYVKKRKWVDSAKISEDKLSQFRY